MTTPITTTADRLMELAAKAAPGPWETDAGDGELDSKARYPTNHTVLVFASDDCDTHPVADCSCNHTCRPAEDQEANAEFIAACDPQTITALCSAIKEMAAENERLRDELEACCALKREYQERAAKALENGNG